MIFVYKKWDEFCRKLSEHKIHSIPSCDVAQHAGAYLVLKHDVETDVSKALQMAKIENKYGHKGSYYVQAYLMQDENNIKMLSEMQAMGHEISYHYDVLDSSKGDMEQAITEFAQNKQLFEDNNFRLITVCQHGNPVVERVGYHSNRDFFRNSKVQAMYPNISDIMVDFKTKANTEYTYYSDAGRKFKRIYDPIENDIVNSDDKNVPFADLNALLTELCGEHNSIVSTHPHRWTSSAVLYTVKAFVFKVVKMVAKVLIKIPLFKKVMSRYYYLAKKI